MSVARGGALLDELPHGSPARGERRGEEKRREEKRAEPEQERERESRWVCSLHELRATRGGGVEERRHFERGLILEAHHEESDRGETAGERLGWAGAKSRCKEQVQREGAKSGCTDQRAGDKGGRLGRALRAGA